jgi:ribose transport system ATP-binding protein
LQVASTLAQAKPPAFDMYGPVVRLEGICKRFFNVNALVDVSLELNRGEVHALCGENGAGKSTLMKVMSGQIQPDKGRLVFKGKPTVLGSSQDAESQGVAMIHQELNLVPHLSAAENIFLAREPRKGLFIDRKRLHSDARRCLERLGVAIETKAIVRTLSVAQRQMVEIAKALSIDATVLIMDEPTSSLTASETDQLFEVILELKRAGVAIVYITHRLDEMARIVDRVTVLRDGRKVATDDFLATSIEQIVERMVGRALDEKFPTRISKPNTEVLFSVSGLSRRGAFQDVSFEIRRGEILGFSGLMGAGRTEVARAIFGADIADAGSIQLGEETLRIRSPRDAIGHGIAYLPEDRKVDGLALAMTVAENVTLANSSAVSNRLGFIRFDRERAAAQGFVNSLQIRTPSTEQIVKLLSGGNQQKIVIAKWLFRDSRILFFDEPTRGIDVGTKYAIYTLLDALAARGIGVVLISSELPEIIGMTDRVAVFHGGRIVVVLDTQNTTQEEIMRYASGQEASAAVAEHES